MLLSDLDDLVPPASVFLPERVSILLRAEPLVVAGDVPDDDRAASAAAHLRHLPTVTIVSGDPTTVPAVLADAADVCLTDIADPPQPWVDGAVDDVAAAVASQPEAALALVSTLRAVDRLPVGDAVAAEAAAYAMLLGSRAFRVWLANLRPPRPKPNAEPTVLAERIGRRLRVTLNRPDARNALDRAMRDELVEAVTVVAADTDLELELRGAGPCFCSGGDLTDFGQVGDPAVAFAVRHTRHPGAAVAAVGDRTTCFVHGPCVGAGVEIPAFAQVVVADPATTFRLPELSMGLIPGAGGTVSISRRVGRHRTAWLALTGATLDADTALAWGLVDRIGDVGVGVGDSGSVGCVGGIDGLGGGLVDGAGGGEPPMGTDR